MNPLFVQLLSGGAGAAPEAPQFDSMLSPEANAFVGSAAPAPARPKKDLRQRVGEIADVLSVIGGGKPMYQEGLERQKQRTRDEAFANFQMNPTPETQAAFIQAAPDDYAKFQLERQSKAQNPGSVSDYQFLVSKLTPMIGEQAAMERAAAIMASRTGQRPIATDRGFMAPDQAVESGAMPFRAPEAPPTPSFTPQTDAEGNILAFDQRTGRMTPTGVRAPVKAPAGGARAPVAGPSAQIAVLDEGIADLKRAEELLQGGGTLTNPIVGLMPEALRNVVAPKTITAEEAVGRVAQKELRAILGGQFAAKEGEQLIRRAFNPSQPASENLKRVQSLRRQIEARRKELAGGNKKVVRFEDLP